MVVVFGLCILCIIFTFTPYSDVAMDHLPPNWRAKTTTSLEEEAILEEIAKDRANSWTHPNDNTVNTSTSSSSNTSTTSLTDTASDNMGEFDGDASEGLVDEDEFHDGLPTVFDEAHFPESSQQILKARIGVKALESYMNDDPRSIDDRAESVAYILRQANTAYRNDSVYSVVIKPKFKMPPSGNIHDYTSLARYYWKNPDTKDGLPYVRHDGKPNPDMDSVWDYRLLRKVFRDCYYMAHGYFWTGEPRYAEKIIYRVKEWFLDEATHMNPNLKYGSLIFGTEMGRAEGVLDMFKVFA